MDDYYLVNKVKNTGDSEAMSHIPYGIGGIYEIENTVNGKRYIGSSSNIRKRLADHRNFLRKNNHNNEHLQCAWNKYGEDKFVYDMVHTCSKDTLLLCEQWVIDQYDFNKELYNMGKKTMSAMTGRKHSAETKLKMSISQSKRVFTEEHKRNIAISKIGRKVCEQGRLNMSASQKGRIMSEETKKKLLLANKGKIRSKEHSRKLSEALKGKKVSEETKEKMSKSATNRLPSKCHRKFPIGTIEKVNELYLSGMRPFEIAKELGISRGYATKIVSNWRRNKYGKRNGQ